MGRPIDEDSVIDIVTYECGEWSGLAKEIAKQIKALPFAEPKLQQTCDQIVINSDGEPVDISDNVSRMAAIANVASIAKVLARSDKQKALCGRIIFMLERMPTAYPVIQEIQREVDYWHDLSNSYEETIIKLTEAVSRQPQIIRCKECKYCDKGIDEDGKPFLKCLGWVYGGTSENDFCSHAERRQDD